MTEVVDAEGALEPVGGLGARAQQHAGVVDEDVETVEPFEHLGGAAVHRCETREVERNQMDVAAGRRPDVIAGTFPARGIARGDDDGETEPGQLGGGGLAESRVAARDEDDFRMFHFGAPRVIGSLESLSAPAIAC
jgi:hypothetical protein